MAKKVNARKQPVHWTVSEMVDLLRYLDANPSHKNKSALLREAQAAVLPEHRRKNPESMNGKPFWATFDRQAASARDLLSLEQQQPMPEPPPPEEKFEQVIEPPQPEQPASAMTFNVQVQVPLETMRTLVREECQLVLNRLLESLQSMPLSVFANMMHDTLPRPTPQAPVVPSKPRVDVIGLLPAQANQVASEMDEQFALRFYSAEQAERQQLTAPHAIVCSKFTSHAAQASVKKAGADIIYANGGTGSVVSALQQLSWRLRGNKDGRFNYTPGVQ